MAQKLKVNQANVMLELKSLGLNLVWANSMLLMILPGIDEVLGQTDAGGRACDGDLAVSRSIHWICNLDLGAWHLPDLIDLCSLAANDAPNQLWLRRAGGVSYRNNRESENTMEMPLDKGSNLDVWSLNKALYTKGGYSQLFSFFFF